MLWCFPRWLGRFCALGFVALLWAENPDPQPDVVTVCELLSAPQQYDRKNVFVLGRISKRGDGRSIGQDSCADMTGKQALAVRFNRQAGPLPPDQFSLNTALAKVKFREVAQHTALQEFRFGSGDYDRWAIVFGRVTIDGQSAMVLCRGEAMIFLWGGSVQ